MTALQQGRLQDAEYGPLLGERTTSVVVANGFSVEQILSGELAGGVGFQQDHDEWVVVLTGGAAMTVGDDPVRLSAGEWLFLPRGTPHHLESTELGTSWLAVRGPGPDSPPGTGGGATSVQGRLR